MNIDKKLSQICKGIAILLVIACHFMGRFGHGIRVFTPLGGIGVAIFLTLSGYGLNESWNKCSSLTMLDAIFFIRFSRHDLCPLFSSAREGARPPVGTGA